jgi:hypothetical protein
VLKKGLTHRYIGRNIGQIGIKQARVIFIAMTTANLDITQPLKDLETAVTEIINLMASIDEQQVNTVPYADSWTAPQLLIHVAKSINGIARALQTPTAPTERDPGQRIPELRNIFLDFSRKFQAPDFIVPEDGPFEKQATIDKLGRSFERFKESAAAANGQELVEGFPFGPATKLELIYFTLYHTERHLQQMKKISEALKNK